MRRSLPHGRSTGKRRRMQMGQERSASSRHSSDMSGRTNSFGRTRGAGGERGTGIEKGAGLVATAVARALETEARPRGDRKKRSKSGRERQGVGRRFDGAFTIREKRCGFTGDFDDFSGNRHKFASRAEKDCLRVPFLRYWSAWNRRSDPASSPFRRACPRRRNSC